MTAVVAPGAAGFDAARDVARQPLLVELVGLAGAGKTTLVRAVLSRVGGARSGLRLHRARDLPSVAAAAGRVAPAFVAAILTRSETAADDARYTVRLLAHRATAARALRSDCSLVLIDEGPVFMLARLIAFGSASLGRGGFARHWERSLEWWRCRLDAVVWLDAPDATLVARIRARAKAHRAKHASDVELRGFLARYRDAYATVVSRMAANGGPPVIHLDSCDPVDLEVDRLLAAVERLPARDT